MSTLPLIQSLWIGRELSVMEQLSISSFLKNGHTFHLYVYNEVKGTPESVVLKDASQIIPLEKIFKYKKYDSYAGFSNLFRYRLLLENGGYWVDTDIVCLVPFKQDSDYIFASEKLHRRYFFRRANNCVIKVPAGAEIMDYCYNESVKRNPMELEWGETGPILLTAAVKKFDMQRYLARTSTFCPINHWHWKRLIRGSFVGSWKKWMVMGIYRSRAVHLWNENWRRSGKNKNANFPKDSLYEQLKKIYLNETTGSPIQG